MPQAIPYIVMAVISAAQQYLTNKSMKALAAAAAKKAPPYSVNYSGTGEPARLLYGTVRVGGMHTVPPFCTGGDGNLLHIVMSVAGHEVSSIDNVWFDNEQITNAMIGSVTGTTSDGLVTGSSFSGIAWLRRYLGTSTQTVDYILQNAFPSAFTADFRGRGVAYVAMQLKHSDKVYSGQIPNFTFDVVGKKVYDPRTGLTTASSNPAVILRDYLVNEVGFPSTAVPDSWVIAAANICDQLVDIPPAATQQKRYQCNLMLSMADRWEDNVRTILASMRGRAILIDGTWRIFAGAWDTPTYTINKSDWVGPTIVKASAPTEERWNTVTGWYVDSARGYQRVACFPRRNTTYETDDGDRLPIDVELQGSTTEYEAQRHSEFELRKSRNQLTISGRLSPEWIKLATWETVYVTDDDYGWSGKTFRVMGMDMAPDDTVSIALGEEGSATWTDLARAEYNTQTTWPTIDPGVTLPSARTNFTATAYAGALGFSWDVNSSPLPNELTRIIEYSNSGYAHLGTEIYRGATTGVVLGKTDTATHFYWVQGVVGSYTGAYTPNTFGLPAAATSGGPGAPGGMGPPGANVLTNGDFTSVNSLTGRVAAWDYGSTAHSYSSTGGPGGVPCLIANSWGSPLTYMSEVPIPVLPLTEALDIEVWVRSVNSGLGVYFGMECLDKLNQPILQDRDVLLGMVQVCSTAPAGASSLAVYKGTTSPYNTGDKNFSGWPNSFGTLILPEVAGVYNWPDVITLTSSTVSVNTVNTAASNSYNIIGITPTLPATVAWDLGVSQVGSLYRVFPVNSAPYICSSAWTRITQRYFGQPTPWARFTATGSLNPELSTFRTQAKKVRFNFGAVTGGSEFRVSQFIVRRVTEINGTLVHDSEMGGGGGLWRWPAKNSMANSWASRIKYTPTSGPAGGGMFVCKPGSSPSGFSCVGATGRDS